VDSAGNVYVAGSRGLLKIDDNGNQALIVLGPFSGLALDSTGRPHVISPSHVNSNFSYDYATARYNSDGTVSWEAFYDGIAHFNDIPVAIAVDDVGNVYVSGASDSKTHVKCDYVCIPEIPKGCRFVCHVVVDESEFATVKYDANGKQLWVATYHGPGTAGFCPRPCSRSCRERLCNGASVQSAANLDYATIKYNSSGQQLWLPTTTVLTISMTRPPPSLWITLAACT